MENPPVGSLDECANIVPNRIGSDLFISNYVGGSISEYTTAGDLVNASLISGLPIREEALAVSGSDLFLGYGNGASGNPTNIGEFTTSGGTVNATLITGLNGPYGIAASSLPAPEPGALALAGAAAAMCAAAYRRRKKGRRGAKEKGSEGDEAVDSNLLRFSRIGAGQRTSSSPTPVRPALSAPVRRAA
jgi:hypothetical protein